VTSRKNADKALSTDLKQCVIVLH